MGHVRISAVHQLAFHHHLFWNTQGAQSGRHRLFVRPPVWSNWNWRQGRVKERATVRRRDYRTSPAAKFIQELSHVRTSQCVVRGIDYRVVPMLKRGPLKQSLDENRNQGKLTGVILWRLILVVRQQALRFTTGGAMKGSRNLTFCLQVLSRLLIVLQAL